MPKNYSQKKALFAIVKANVITSFRSPYAVLLGILFPIVFIVAFSFASSNFVSLNVLLLPGCDTSSIVYKALKKIDYIHFQSIDAVPNMQTALQKGEIIAVLDIKNNNNDISIIPYTINVISSTSTEDKFRLFEIILDNTINTINQAIFSDNRTMFVVQKDIIHDRPYKSVDFILPGQLGFSLLTIGIMGVAFSIFHLRESLVLKRFRATPIRKTNILIGEAIGRILFQLFTITILLIVGKYVFDFTIIHGFFTYLEIIILCFLGLLVFMGMGFSISGIVKNDHTIPILGNMLMFPQLIFSGTFFSIEIFPQWLKVVAYCLPLTPLNDALRKVSFEGYHLWEILPQLGILLLWIVIVYIFASKTFKWE
ncbi:MAG: ABC transporter permease [Chitinophagaceae bacterium]